MKPQKALHKYKADEKKTKKYIGHNYLMLPKVDGWYGYKEVGGDDPIRSNAQRIIPSCLNKSEQLTVSSRGLPKGRLIFEITVDGTPQFEIMNGILNRKALCPDVRLNLHDFIPFDRPEAVTWERYCMTREIFNGLDLPWISMIDHLGSSDVPEKWESTAVQLIDKGVEGLILKRMDAGYSPGKRNEDLMKIKEECEFDLLCVGFNQGAVGTKYQYTLGALVLHDKQGKTFTVSGMTDKQRNDWFNTPSMILRKVVKVKAKNVMKDGSLREGRFSVIRYDKNADDIDTIKEK